MCRSSLIVLSDSASALCDSGKLQNQWHASRRCARHSQRWVRAKTVSVTTRSMALTTDPVATDIEYDESMKGRMRTGAEAIARAAHAGQVDKAGRPYIEHPERVAARLIGDDLLAAIGWLHDVVEDTAVSLTDLEASFPVEVTEAVAALTRRAGEDPVDYYRRVAANPRALRVKAADIDDNTDPDRLAQLDEQTRSRLVAKYAKARALLGV